MYEQAHLKITTSNSVFVVDECEYVRTCKKERELSLQVERKRRREQCDVLPCIFLHFFFFEIDESS